MRHHSRPTVVAGVNIRRSGLLAQVDRYAALSLQVCLRVGSCVHGNAGARIQRGSALQAGGRQSRARSCPVPLGVAVISRAGMDRPAGRVAPVRLHRPGPYHAPPRS